MSDDALISLEGLELGSSKKVPVCICLDTTEGMRYIWDEELISVAKKLVESHQDHPAVKRALGKNKKNVSFDLIVEHFYDELPQSIRDRYGKTKEDMLKRKMGKVETGAEQSRQVLKIFFETLRSEHQKAIDVEVCVITFSDGKAEVVIPSNFMSW